MRVLNAHSQYRRERGDETSVRFQTTGLEELPWSLVRKDAWDKSAS